MTDRWDTSQLFSHYRTRHYDASLYPSCSEVWEQVTDYLEDLSKETSLGIVFVGPPGTGKTLLAHEVAREVIKHPTKLRAVKFSQYMENISEMMTLSKMRSIEAEKQYMELYAQQKTYQKVRWLLLDDVGLEYQTDSGWVQSRLSLLLRSRGDAGRPTIMTTNVPIPEWEKQYGASTASYLHQLCVTVKVSGPDARRARG